MNLFVFAKQYMKNTCFEPWNHFCTVKRHVFGMLHWSNRGRTTFSMLHPSLIMEILSLFIQQSISSPRFSIHQNVWWSKNHGFIHVQGTITWKNSICSSFEREKMGGKLITLHWSHSPSLTTSVPGEVDGVGRRAGPLAALPPALPGAGRGHVSLWRGGWVFGDGDGEVSWCLTEFNSV